MKTDLFDYYLPQELIAQTPAKERSGSRLLVYNRSTNKVEHRHFSDISDYFEEGDLLIVNSSRVIPARIHTIQSEYSTAGSEIFFIKKLDDCRFEAMVHPGKKFKPGKKHKLPNGSIVVTEEVLETGLRVLRMEDGSDPIAVFRENGEMPLPPYITSRESAPERYQTVYSKEEGSVAAPTAGLHFDDKVFADLKAKGVRRAEVILHVGLGTFKPVEVDDLENHHMHEERFFISEETAKLFKETREAGKKIWACGTTTVRTLESAVNEKGELQTGWNSTACFIKPGYQFKAIDHLITNFHLPKSTLIVLVSAFAGREKTLELYNEAVKNKYRFYSFGDSMLLI